MFEYLILFFSAFNDMSGVEAIVGFAAGAAGFISLGLQLCDYSLTLSRLYHDAKGAPKTLETIASELNLIGQGVKQLERFRQESGSSDVTSVRYLDHFRARTAEIRTLVDDISTRISKYKRLRGIAFAAFKERDIVDLISRLEASKTSLTGP